MMNKKLFLLALALFAGFVLSAQTLMPFIRFDRDPATAALGGAYAASAVQNPAITALSGAGELRASLQSWAPQGAKATHLNLLGGMCLGKLGLTAVAAYQAGESYAPVGDNGMPGEAVTPAESLIGLGVGFAFTETLSVGAKFNLASQNSGAGDSWNAFAVDAFVAYQAGDLKLAAGVSSLGGAVGGFALPASATVGADYAKSFGTSGIRLVAELDCFFSGAFGGGLGVQYGFRDMVFVRGGYHLGSDKAPTPSYASAGFGLKFSDFRIDASYIAGGALGGTFGLGVGYAF